MNAILRYLSPRQLEPFLYFFISALLTACTVWKSDHSRQLVKQPDGNYAEVDTTRTRNGQPYFLPRGMIHLVIKPGAAAPKEEAKKEEAKDNGGNPATGSGETAQSAEASGTEGVSTYQVSVGVEFVPDKNAGTYYARYSPNWLFNDQVAVSVNAKRLLNTVTTTTTDETKNIIDKLADTAANIIKFTQGGGLGAGLGRSEKGRSVQEVLEMVPELPTLKVKQMQIDERFDPLNPADCARISALFNDQLGKRYKILSPFNIEFRVSEPVHGSAARVTPEKWQREGLWFREPQQVEIVLKRNPRFFEVTQTYLTRVNEICETLQKAKPDAEAAAAKEAAEAKARAAERRAVAGAEAPAQNPAAAAVAAAANNQGGTEAGKEQAQEVLPAQEAANKLQAKLTAMLKLQAEYEKLYYAAQPGASATLGSFVTTVANPERPYALSIKRSAFIARTTNVTIDNGMLTGIGHNKPSEVLGFVDIPFSVTTKLLALPKAIFTQQKDVLTEKNAAQAQKSKTSN